ncbi:MAG: hypothetical protein LBV18_06780 [Alistipes sp.]|nr:hypothetical protein [Alistipes sp.]
MRNAFLTQRLRPIAPVSVVRDDYSEGLNYITRENYDYLRASAKRYAELLGKKLNHDQGASTGEGITNLYRELDKLIGGDVNLNIEPENERLVFVLWKNYSWGDYYFYWIPVKFVEGLNPQLRRIAISFLHQLMKTNGLDTTNDSYDFEMMHEWYWERSADPAEDDCDRLARLSFDYSARGKVGRLMKRIETKNYYKRLAPALDRYAPQSAHERKLIALMRRGLAFIGKNKRGIMSYAYDPFRDEKRDDDYDVQPSRMILLTYDVDSDFEEQTRSHICEELNNGYEIMAAATLILRPDGKDVFVPDDYPTEFYKYLDELVYFLRTIQ